MRSTYSSGRETLVPLVRDNPRVSSFRYTLGLVDYVLGSSFFGFGRYDEALASYQSALENVGGVVRENPTEERYQSPGVSGILLSTGELHRIMGNLGPALTTMKSSLEVQEALTAKNPESLMNQVNLAMVHRSIGNVQVEGGDARTGIASARRALAILEPLLEKNPQHIMVLSELYPAKLTLGAGLRLEGQIDEALRWYQRAEAHLTSLLTPDPSNEEYRVQLALCLARISALERSLGRTADASGSWERAHALVEKTPHELPERLFSLAVIRSVHVPLIAGKGADAETRRHTESDQALEPLQQAAAKGFRNVVWLRQDPDLEPIRSRTEFQALIQTMQNERKTSAP